jgi:hypothetical protein
MTCRHLTRPTAPSAYSSEHLCLGDLIHRPMPRSVRGALLRSIPPLPTQPIHTVWMTGTAAAPLRPGSILLSWEPDLHGGMDVTARLGLAATEVLLANWPALQGDWTPVVHPTLLEVTGLHAALSVAIDALHLANHLAVAS